MILDKKISDTRNITIDIAKGLGIFCVVWGHSSLEIGHYMIYMFHMPLFIFLSGYFHKTKCITDLVKAKTKSLLIPYFFFFVINTIIDLLVFDDFSHKQIHIFNPSGSAGPLWFLLCLFSTCILYQIINKVANKYTGTICFITTMIGWILSIYNLKLILFLDSTFSILLFYHLGNNCSKRKIKEGSIKELLFSILSFSGCYFICVKIAHLGINDIYSNTIMNNFIMYTISAVSGIYQIITISKLIASRITIISYPIAYIGKLSIYIFVFHLAILRVVECYFSSINFVLNIILIMFYIIVCLIAGNILSHFFPKIFCSK